MVGGFFQGYTYATLGSNHQTSRRPPTGLLLTRLSLASDRWFTCFVVLQVSLGGMLVALVMKCAVT